MKKIFIFIAILSALVCSCEKDSEYPKTFKNASFSDSNLQLYTKYGEITDSSIKNDFFYRNGDFALDLENFDLNNFNSFKFKTENLAEVFDKDGNSLGVRNIIKTSEITYLESVDTTKIFSSKTFLEFQHNFFKYSPLLYEEYPIASMTGYQMIQIFNHCIYVKNHKNYLEIPYLDFYLKKSNSYLWMNRQNNSFKTNFYSSLNETDTLMIQSYNLILKQ